MDNKIWSTVTSSEIPIFLKLLELPEQIFVSALYPSFSDTNSYIVRLENLTDKNVLVPKDILNKGIVVNALEKTINDNRISPYDFISIRLSI